MLKHNLGSILYSFEHFLYFFGFKRMFKRTYRSARIGRQLL